MSESSPDGGSRQYLRVFRRYVLEPLSSAERRVSREREVIDAERAAFEAFGDAVADVRPPASGQPDTPARATLVSPRSDAAATLRSAYRETVMAVPHYEAEYDESLGENLAAELGPGLAAVLETDEDPTFTAAHMDTLQAAVEKSIRERERFANALDSELASVRSCSTRISELVDSLDDTLIPGWYSDQFEGELEDIVGQRQAAIQGRPVPAHLDGHNLCAYLYVDHPWTYPVLTAVARLRDSVGTKS